MNKREKYKITNILDDPYNIETTQDVPAKRKIKDNEGYYANVTAIFVDIRNSTKLFDTNNRPRIARIIKVFTSTILDELEGYPNAKEIGVRGDCVYAIYLTSDSEEKYKIFQKSINISKSIKDINNVLAERQMEQIKIGTGIASGNELIINTSDSKNGHKNLVWIGGTITHAAKFSSLANTGNYKDTIINDDFYNSIKKIYKNDKNFEQIKYKGGINCYAFKSKEIVDE